MELPAGFGRATEYSPSLLMRGDVVIVTCGITYNLLRGFVIASGAPEGIEVGEHKNLMNKNPDVATNWRYDNVPLALPPCLSFSPSVPPSTISRQASALCVYVCVCVWCVCVQRPASDWCERGPRR